MLLTGNERAYFSGSLPSNTPSNSVTFCSSAIFGADAQLLHRLEIEVGAQDPLRDAVVIRRPLRHAPAAELGQPPFRVDLVRVVAGPVREDHVVRVLFDPAVAVGVLAEQPLENRGGRAVDVGGPADDLRELRAVLELVQIDAGEMQRLQDRLDGARILLRELLGERADFFRVVFPQLLRGDGGEPGAVFDGPVVPRLADAEAVHLVDLHVRDHLRRRDRDEVDVPVRMDPAGGEPVANPHRVRAGRERHRECERIARGLGLFGDGFDLSWRLRADCLQLVVQRDRLAVPVEQPRNHHRLHRRPRQPHGRRQRHADQHVRGLVLAERQLVADHRPRRFLRDGRLDAELLEIPELVGDDDRRAVGQRDDAEPDGRRLWRVAGIHAARPPAWNSGEQRRGRSGPGGCRQLDECSSRRFLHLTSPPGRRR